MKQRIANIITRYPWAPSGILVLILYVTNLNNGFFWDTVQLSSKHADYFYRTNFQSILLPDYIDSGHIPAFGMYLAFVWKLFGRGIMISHLAMLPFVIGTLWQGSLLARRFVPNKYVWIALLLIILDPTLLSQMILISPDVPLVFFFLLGVNSIFKNNTKWLGFSVTMLFLVSMRGMMAAFALLLLDVVRNIDFNTKFKEITIKLLKRSVIYLPSLLVFIAYYAYHYQVKSWIAIAAHDESPWADCFAPVGLKGAIRNVFIIGWRLIDFGRIGAWLVFFLLFVRYQKQIVKIKENRLLLLFWIILAIVLSANGIWAKNLSAHRYLLPVYLIFSLLTANILFAGYIPIKIKKTFTAIWLILLVSGNFWIYPPNVSQGWDSTLAHVPYYQLREKAIEYLDDQNIAIDSTATFFPNGTAIDDIDLNGDERSFKHFEKDEEYVLYSNVYNVSDLVIQLINTEYKLLKQFKKCQVYINIYQKSDYSPSNE